MEPELSATEAAELIGCSLRTVQQLGASGALPSMKGWGKTGKRLYLRSDVLAYKAGLDRAEQAS